MTARLRAEAFASRFGMSLPILHAPMAGLQQTDLALAVMAAGGMGGFGGAMSSPEEPVRSTSRKACTGR